MEDTNKNGRWYVWIVNRDECIRTKLLSLYFTVCHIFKQNASFTFGTSKEIKDQKPKSWNNRRFLRLSCSTGWFVRGRMCNGMNTNRCTKLLKYGMQNCRVRG